MGASAYEGQEESEKILIQVIQNQYDIMRALVWIVDEIRPDYYHEKRVHRRKARHGLLKRMGKIKKILKGLFG